MRRFTFTAYRPSYERLGETDATVYECCEFSDGRIAYVCIGRGASGIGWYDIERFVAEYDVSLADVTFLDPAAQS